MLSSSSPSPTIVCLNLVQTPVTLLLSSLILSAIIGNVLVILSVFVYKRMRTFANILLTSLSIADLLVGLLIMPLSLFDLLRHHNWPFDSFLCWTWATLDVLLCTASILNLCIISLDRYMAITSPLRYPRTRSRKTAAILLGSVWMLSAFISSPPWFIPKWGIFAQYVDSTTNANVTNGSTATDSDHRTFVCMYSLSVHYRIYSALGSFYIPLVVMLCVYFKIMRVTWDREKMLRNSLQKDVCRLSSTAKDDCLARKMTVNNVRSMSVIDEQCVGSKLRELDDSMKKPTKKVDVIDSDVSIDVEIKARTSKVDGRIDTVNCDGNGLKSSLKKKCHSFIELNGKNTALTLLTTSPAARLTSLACLFNRSDTTGSSMVTFRNTGRLLRGNKEKLIYLRERKALKTIAVVVLGFIACWMPFFIFYLVEVFSDRDDSGSSIPLGDLFLWLGYSNSAINPFIYTMYNRDFRRCFRDLVTFGCFNRHRHRSMSVRKLHQRCYAF